MKAKHKIEMIRKEMKRETEVREEGDECKEEGTHVTMSAFVHTYIHTSIYSSIYPSIHPSIHPCT